MASQVSKTNGATSIKATKLPRKTPMRNSRPSRGGGGFPLVNFVARIIAWYALYTVLFRCPTPPTADSPGICHPAHTFKTALQPHVLPYYDTYVSPYVQRCSPRIQQVNEAYITPAYNTACSLYHKYGELYISKGYAYALGGYDRVLKSHVATTQDKAQYYYILYLSPHVETATKVWVKDLKPSVDGTGRRVEVFWQGAVLPTYRRVQPYIAKAYEQGRYVVMVVVAPVVKEGGEKAVGWGRDVWSEVVRPQVGRIGERLGGASSHGVPASAVSSSIFSSLSSVQPSREAATDASISSMIASVSAKASASASRAHSSAETLKLTKAQVKEVIEKDLESWTAKFNAASEKTLADLKSQIDEISERAHDSKHSAVEKDIINLQNLVDTGFSTLKAKIVSLVQTLSSGSIAEEKAGAEEKLLAATRRLGTEIRDKAQGIRKDAEKYLAKVYDDVSEAADQHLEVLDGINDMGMQELGMKWAWMDFVSYKDWERYHDLKKSMRESRAAIIRSAESNKKLKEITNWVESEWEGKATAVAKRAAEELKRVKGAGKRKIELTDFSDDFSDDYIPIPGKKANQWILGGKEKVKQVVVSSEDNEDTIKEEIINPAEDAISAVREFIGTAPPKPGVESVVPTTSEASENVISQEFETTRGTGPEAATAVSEASDSVSSAASGAPERVKSRIPGGVEAGFVATTESVLYDEEDIITNDARSLLAEASRAVSEAIAHAAATHPTPVAESLRSRYSELSESAIYAASSVLYGTPTPVTEQIASIATDKYSAAVAAASSVIYGKPTPVHELYLQKAKQAYIRATEAAGSSLGLADGLAAAESAESRKSVKESMYSVASERYSAAIAAAAASSEASVSAFNIVSSGSSVASEAAASVTSAAVDIADIAQHRYLELQNLVNELIHNKEPSFSESVMFRVSSIVYGTPTPILSHASSYLVSTTSAAAQAVASMPPAINIMISDAVSRVKAAAAAEASEAVYGKEPTQLEKYQQKLQALGEEALNSVSVAIYGTPKGGFEQATSTVASVASEAVEKVVSAVDGAKEAAQGVGVKLGFLEAHEECKCKQSLMEIAKKRIGYAIEAALGDMRKAAEEYKEKAEEGFESMNERIRDEL